MRKQFLNFKTLFLLVFTGLALTSCSDDDDSAGAEGNARISVRMVDAPGDYDAVNIDGNFSVNTFFVVLNSLESSATFPSFSWVFGAKGPMGSTSQVPALYGVKGAGRIAAELPFQSHHSSLLSVNGNRNNSCS